LRIEHHAFGGVEIDHQARARQFGAGETETG
jgi:hypothetical protein